MKKIIPWTFLLFMMGPAIAAPTYKMTFDDGLPATADSIEYTTATDRSGREIGIYQYEYFYIDINKDSKPDRITRARYTSPTAAYTFYRIELQGANRKYDLLPITDFRTVEEYGCFFRVFKFGFTPRFTIYAISRDKVENCVTPTATRMNVHELVNSEIVNTGNFNALPTTDVRLIH